MKNYEKNNAGISVEERQRHSKKYKIALKIDK